MRCEGKSSDASIGWIITTCQDVDDDEEGDGHDDGDYEDDDDNEAGDDGEEDV